MKRRRRFFGVLLIITALIIMQLPVTEADAATSASDFKMEGTTLVKYKGTDTKVTLPDTVEVISATAFEGNGNIEELVIPKSVEHIEPYAFWDCDSLKTVVLGSGLKEIEDYVFTNCKGLQKISVPSTVSSIGIQAFADCVNLQEIYIPPEVYHIHDTAFDGCVRLTIKYETGSVAGGYAEEFYLKQQEMPEYEDVNGYVPKDETEAGNENNTADSASAPETVPEYSEETAFIGSSRVVGNQAVIFTDNTELEVLEGALIQETINASTQENAGDKADGLPKYTIVDGMNVADQAYYCSEELKNVALPDGIRQIGQFSFARSSVEQVVIPEGTETIGYGAFYHCDALQSVTLPESVRNVEPKAFAHSGWVESFLQGEGTGESADEDFLISGGVLAAYRGNAARVSVPDDVRVIAAEVFAGHEEIHTLYLPDGLEVIGEAAFEGCSSLSSVYFGDGLLQIKDRAFADCALEKAVLPVTLEELGLQAFDEQTVQKSEDGSSLAYVKQTHELTAERLSNESYRLTDAQEKEKSKTAGVTVSGIEGAQAYLEGAATAYTLYMSEAADGTKMQKAYSRCFEKELPDNAAVYELRLTDNSEIPITKLGRQKLQITLPVPKELEGCQTQVYCLDRNGQLEKAVSERVNADGTDSITLSLDYVSEICIVNAEAAREGETIWEQTVSVVSMSAAPSAEADTGHTQAAGWQPAAAGLLVLLGIICVVKK